MLRFGLVRLQIGSRNCVLVRWLENRQRGRDDDGGWIGDRWEFSSDA